MATFNVSSGDVVGLISAIIAANANSEADTINLATGVYDLGDYDFWAELDPPPRESDPLFFSPGMPLGVSEINGLPLITSTITIAGGSSNRKQTIITRKGVQHYRLIFVTDTGSLTLQNLSLQRGNVGAFDTGGGGILNQGTVSLTNCLLGPDNKSGYGGGLGNGGIATLETCEITGNEGGWGGGLHNGDTGTMTVDDSLITDNFSPDGGGIINFGVLTVEGCKVMGNRGWSGGGIATYGSNAETMITGSIIAQNEASTGAGVYQREGEVVVNTSQIYDNFGGDGDAVTNDVTDPVDAKYNWWGSASGPVSSKIVGNVDTSNYQTTEPTPVTYWYSRRQAAKRAANASRNNFASFPTRRPKGSEWVRKGIYCLSGKGAGRWRRNIMCG
jgi:hypothetical protein